MIDPKFTQEKHEAMLNLTLIVMNVAEALIAVIEHEGLTVEDMTLNLQDKDTGEIRELTTTPQQVIAWAKKELGIDAGGQYD